MTCVVIFHTSQKTQNSSEIFRENAKYENRNNDEKVREIVNCDLTKKISKHFLAEKNCENALVLYCYAVVNFVLTRKMSNKYLAEEIVKIATRNVEMI